MFCTSCGAQMPDGIKFCTRCGASLSTSMAGNTTPPPASGETSHPTARGGSYAARFINEPSPVPHRASATPPPPPPPPQARPTYAAPRPTSYPLPPAEGNVTRRLVLAGICLVLAFLSLPSSALMMGIVPGGMSFLGSPVPEIPLRAFFTIFVTLGMPFFLICLILQSCMRTVTAKPGEADIGPKLVNLCSAVLVGLWMFLLVIICISVDDDPFDNIRGEDYWEMLLPICSWGAILALPAALAFGTQVIAYGNTAPWRRSSVNASLPILLCLIFSAIFFFASMGTSMYTYERYEGPKERLKERVEDLEEWLDEMQEHNRDSYSRYDRYSESEIEDVEERLDDAREKLSDFTAELWFFSGFPNTIFYASLLLGILLTWCTPRPSIAGAIVCTVGGLIYWGSLIRVIMALDSSGVDWDIGDNPALLLILLNGFHVIPLGWLMYAVRRESWPQAPAA